MITNEDISKLKEVFVTKDDLKEQIADIKVEFSEVHAKIDTVAAGVARIENAIDKLSGNIQDLRTENAAGAVHLARHDRQIDALAHGTKIAIPEWVP